MKKGDIIEGIVERVDFPNRGIILAEDKNAVIVKNAIPGQNVRVRINKARKGKYEGHLLEILEKSPDELAAPACVHAGICGGCAFQSLPYEKQLAMKAEQIKRLLDQAVTGGEEGYRFLGIQPSPRQQEYRNKMEFSFGDEVKDGPLTLGMHKRGSFYDVVSVPECRIVDEDIRRVLSVTLSYFQKKEIPYYHKLRHTGYLRHLLVRKAAKTGEMLVDLVTTTQTEAFLEQELLSGWKQALTKETYEGRISGVLHTKNDSVADTVKNEGTDILEGTDYFYEELLGLRFKITPFSFFQTNSTGAEILYETVQKWIGDTLTKTEGTDGNIVFDLYSGTGTIAQMLAPVAKKVIGVEIVQEAVEAARENAILNGLHNCEFIAGDVLKVMDEIVERPDYIVLDPPRDGIHPKVLEKIVRYGVPRMVYISCKATSLARDLKTLQAWGYWVEQACCVDMFPGTYHVETIVGLQRQDM